MVSTDPMNAEKTVKLWLDGGGTVSKPIVIHRRTKQPPHETYEEGKTYTKDFGCCKRILDYLDTFKKGAPKYDPLVCNSNFAFRCMLLACGADFEQEFTKDKVVKPTGYYCNVTDLSTIPPTEKPTPCPGLKE